MEKTNKSIQKSNLDSLIEKAKSVGFDEVPDSTSELESQICEIFQKTGKIFTAKQIQKLLPQKETKWYSDKLWYMAKKGTLRKLETRGYYQWGGNSS